MDINLLNGLSDEKIAEYLEKYKDNPAVVQQLNGIKESRAKNAEAAEMAFKEEAEKAKAESEFMESVVKLATKHLKNPPSSVVNIQLRWVKTLIKAEKDGKEVEVEKWAWAFELNHVCKAEAKQGSSKPSEQKKLEVTAYKLEADPTDATKKTKKVLGKYASMRAACNANGVTATAASARQDAMHAGIFFE